MIIIVRKLTQPFKPQASKYIPHVTANWIIATGHLDCQSARPNLHCDNVTISTVDTRRLG